MRAFAEPQALLDDVELVIVAVPDDAIAPLARTIRMYSGQAMVHTSGALDADVLAPAQAAGTQVGAFHPLVAFADTERAVAALHGATVAIEVDDQLAALLADMAEAVGARPVRLAPGSKAAYHAAAVLAAGGFVALLDAIATLGRVAGLDEAGALAIYGPLIEGTLGNARALGIGGGPDRADRARGPRDARRASRRAPGRGSRCAAALSGAGGAGGGPGPGPWHAGNGARRSRAGRPCKGRTGTGTIGLDGPASIAAKYAARPAAHFVRASARARERRMGLVSASAFRPAVTTATVLRRPDVAPLTSLRGRWRSIRPAGPRPSTGRPHHAIVMHWTRSQPAAAARRPSAASASSRPMTPIRPIASSTWPRRPLSSDPVTEGVLILRKPDYERRVAVTGLGVVSPVGNDVQTVWGNLVEGRSGLGPITRFDPSPYEAKLAGEVRDFTASDWMDAKAARRSESSMHFGVAAAKQALADSGFELTDENRTEVGVIFGSGAGGQAMMIDNYTALHERGNRTVAPTFIANALVDSCSGMIAIETGAIGHNVLHGVGLRDRHAQRGRGGRGHPAGRLYRGHLRLDRGPAARGRPRRLLEHARHGHATSGRGARDGLAAVRPDP